MTDGDRFRMGRYSLQSMGEVINHSTDDERRLRMMTINDAMTMTDGDH